VSEYNQESTLVNMNQSLTDQSQIQTKNQSFARDNPLIEDTKLKMVHSGLFEFEDRNPTKAKMKRLKKVNEKPSLFRNG
jgi:hypothetical protein